MMVLLALACSDNEVNALVPEGFTLQQHHLTLSGLCDECA